MGMRKQWTDALMLSEVTKVADGLGRMPTNSELEELGRSDLANQIVRRGGGFSKTATRLGLERIHSDSDTGWDGENEMASKFEKREFIVVRCKEVRAPYDLLINGSIRVDVKTAKFAEYGPCRGWFYRIGKHAQADLFALYQLDTGDCYFIPWYLAPTTNITIARDGGKYARFLNRYDLLRQLSETRLCERSIWPETVRVIQPCNP